MGVSCKLIRILGYLYEVAKIRIKLSEEDYTEEIPITIGLMQGDSLSPLLFSLYIYDIEEELKKLGIGGIQISDKVNLEILLYADDTVILALTPGELQKKIRHLEKYFDKLGLTVNIGKSQVVVFRKGGRIEKGVKFYYGSQELCIVNEYNYLGVCFSSFMVFRKATNLAKSKAAAAAGAVRTILAKGRSTSYNTAVKMFESMVKSTVLYCSEIWSLSYLKELETVQMDYFRRYLGVARDTRSVLLRLETGRVKLTAFIIKRGIALIHKVDYLESNRYVKAVLDRLVKMDGEDRTGKNYNYNWFTNFKRILIKESLGQVSTFYSMLEVSGDEIIRSISNNMYQDDVRSMRGSSQLLYYDVIHKQGNRKEEEYMNLGLPLWVKRLVAAVRLNSAIICLGDTYYKFAREESGTGNFINDILLSVSYNSRDENDVIFNLKKGLETGVAFNSREEYIQFAQDLKQVLSQL